MIDLFGWTFGLCLWAVSTFFVFGSAALPLGSILGAPARPWAMTLSLLLLAGLTTIPGVLAWKPLLRSRHSLTSSIPYVTCLVFPVALWSGMVLSAAIWWVPPADFADFEICLRKGGAFLNCEFAVLGPRVEEAAVSLHPRGPGDPVAQEDSVSLLTDQADSETVLHDIGKSQEPPTESIEVTADLTPDAALDVATPETVGTGEFSVTTKVDIVSTGSEEFIVTNPAPVPAEPNGPTALSSEPAEADFAAYSALVLEEINLARTSPSAYADFVTQFKSDLLAGRTPKGNDCSEAQWIAAIDEAVDFLGNQSPIDALEMSPGLCLAAQDHVETQGPMGAMGHVGSDGSTILQRVDRHTPKSIGVGENISYGTLDARRMVVRLIVDVTYPGRDHRVNLFDPRFRFAGVASGVHENFSHICVMDFAFETGE